MPCGCSQKNKTVRWKWVSPEGATYANLTEVAAKAKVARYGGTAQPM